MSDKKSCENYHQLIVEYVDGIISPENKMRLQTHLKTCAACREDLEKLQKWKGVSEQMKGKLLPDMAWDEYWQHIYNRLERGIGWILISVGAIIFLGIAVYQFVINVLTSTEITSLEKAGILLLSIGFVVLLVSVLREKLMVRKYDKYKEIQR